MNTVSLVEKNVITDGQRQTLVGNLLCGSLAILLLVASIAKSFDMEHFREVLIISNVSLSNWAPTLTILVVIVEFLLAIGLLLPKSRKVALIGSIVLFSSFASYSLLRSIVSPGTPCSCLGTLFAIPNQITFAVDLLLLLLCAYLYTRQILLERKPSGSGVLAPS